MENVNHDVLSIVGKLGVLCHKGSGFGSGAILLREVCNELDSMNLNYKVFTTHFQGHAVELARSLIDFDKLIVIGGDGTLHEVVQGLLNCASRPLILYVPAGTGNDFSRSWYSSTLSLRDRLSLLVDGNVVDVPILTFKNVNADDWLVAINSVGLGFDAIVTYESKRLKIGRLLRRFGLGKLSYFFGIFKSLPKLKSFDVHVDKIDVVRRCYLFEVMTNPYFGGGILLDSYGRASSLDFSIIGIHSVTFSKVFSLLYRVFIAKDLVGANHSNVYYKRSDSLYFSLDSALLGQVDGELLEFDAGEYVVEMSDFRFLIG